MQLVNNIHRYIQKNKLANSLMKIIKKAFKKLFKSDLEDRIKVLEEKITKLELKVNTTSKEAGSVRRFG